MQQSEHAELKSSTFSRNKLFHCCEFVPPSSICFDSSARTLNFVAGDKATFFLFVLLPNHFYYEQKIFLVLLTDRIESAQKVSISTFVVHKFREGVGSSRSHLKQFKEPSSDGNLIEIELLLIHNIASLSMADSRRRRRQNCLRFDFKFSGICC